MTIGGLADVESITFDFGNTLLPVDRAGLRAVVEITGQRVVERLGPFPLDRFMTVWSEERERQFREEVPEVREVDIAERLVRVLARLRGMAAPPREQRWDQLEAARWSAADEVAWAVDVYSAAFVEAMPFRPEVTTVLAQLAGRHRLAILSNWPLAATVDRYAERAGWMPHLAAVVVSQRIGTIKPHPRIFEATRQALGAPEPQTILHVGDDWAADVVGARRAGWKAAHVRVRPDDSPLPGSMPDGSVTADVEIDDVVELPGILANRPRALA